MLYFFWKIYFDSSMLLRAIVLDFYAFLENLLLVEFYMKKLYDSRIMEYLAKYCDLKDKEYLYLCLCWLAYTIGKEERFK